MVATFPAHEGACAPSQRRDLRRPRGADLRPQAVRSMPLSGARHGRDAAIQVSSNLGERCSPKLQRAGCNEPADHRKCATLAGRAQRLQCDLPAFADLFGELFERAIACRLRQPKRYARQECIVAKDPRVAWMALESVRIRRVMHAGCDEVAVCVMGQRSLFMHPAQSK